MIHAHVALHAYGIDAQAALAKLADEFDHGIAFALGPHVVVVVIEFGIGVGLVGILERQRYELLAQNLVEGRAAVAAILHDGLVDHIPALDLTLVTADNGRDVLLHYGLELLGRA